MFIDRAVVRVTAGTGGSGASSFARFKYKPKGGPDGGDGGHGGSIYVRGDANLATLLDYRYRNAWKAERGEHGRGKTQTGASSADVYLPVPPGTVVRDADTGELLGEVLQAGDTIRVAKGGRGGRGNARFATSTHQAPREWEPGEEGEERFLRRMLHDRVERSTLLVHGDPGTATRHAAVSWHTCPGGRLVSRRFSVRRR